MPAGRRQVEKEQTDFACMSNDAIISFLQEENQTPARETQNVVDGESQSIGFCNDRIMHAFKMKDRLGPLPATFNETQRFIWFRRRRSTTLTVSKLHLWSAF